MAASELRWPCAKPGANRAGTRRPRKAPWTAPGVVASTPVLNVRTRVQISREYNGPSVLPMPYAPTQLDISGAIGDWHESYGSLMVFNDGLRPGQPVVHRAEHGAQSQAGQYPRQARTRRASRQTSGPTTGPTGLCCAISPERTRPARRLRWRGRRNWRTGSATTSATASSPAFPPPPTGCRRSSRPTSAATAPSSPGHSPYWRGSSVSRPGSRSATPAASRHMVRAKPGRSLPQTRTPGPSSTSPVRAGFGSSRRRRARGGQTTAEVPAYAGVGNTLPNHKQNPGTAPTSSASTTPAGGPHAGRHHGVQAPGAGSPPRSQSAASDLWLAIGIPVGVFLLIAWPALIRIATRRRRWLTASSDADVAHAAWRELTDDLADYGLGFAPAETPRAVARRVAGDAHLDESGIQAVKRISAAEERARYARLADPGTGLKASVRTARRAFSASVPRRQRLRARLLPASTLLAARQLAQRGGVMLSWLDFSWPAVRRQLRAVVHRPG